MSQPITHQEYQLDAFRTINHDLTEREQLANLAMGAAGEAGEILEHIKKHLFQGHELDIAAILDELGDLQYYTHNLATYFKRPMDQILDQNVIKRRKRFPNGFSTERSINRAEQASPETVG